MVALGECTMHVRHGSRCVSNWITPVSHMYEVGEEERLHERLVLQKRKSVSVSELTGTQISWI